MTRGKPVPAVGHLPGHRRWVPAFGLGKCRLLASGGTDRSADVHSVQPAGCAVHFVHRQAEPVPQTPEPLTAGPEDRLLAAATGCVRQGGAGIVIAFSPLWVLDRRGVHALALMASSCSVLEPVGLSSR